MWENLLSLQEPPCHEFFLLLTSSQISVQINYISLALQTSVSPVSRKVILNKNRFTVNDEKTLWLYMNYEFRNFLK